MRFRFIVRITIGLLIGASLVASFLQQSPENVARRYCVEHGVAADKLAMLDYKLSWLPIAARESIEFQIKGPTPPKKLVIELRQPVYFFPWHVVDFREEALR